MAGGTCPMEGMMFWDKICALFMGLSITVD
jgi:hypothetical protein